MGRYNQVDLQKDLQKWILGIAYPGAQFYLVTQCLKQQPARKGWLVVGVLRRCNI